MYPGRWNCSCSANESWTPFLGGSPRSSSDNGLSLYLGGIIILTLAFRHISSNPVEIHALSVRCHVGIYHVL